MTWLLHLLQFVKNNGDENEPPFPNLYSENWEITKPRKHLQTMLKLNDRPKATLHSFRHTFNHELAKLELQIDDRRILLARASSETTKIYTHPNFELAKEYINRIPIYNGFRREKCRDIVGKLPMKKEKLPHCGAVFHSKILPTDYESAALPTINIPLYAYKPYA